MKSKDAAEFTALWTAAQPKVAAFVRMLVHVPQDSEEILQRVAVALVHKFQQFDRQKSFVAWAIGMARFEILYFRRQRAHDKHLFSDDIVQSLADRSEEYSNDWEHFREALKRCLTDLEQRSKQALVLRYSENMRSEAIAKELEMSSVAVRVLLCRVRKSLHECIQRRVANPGAIR